MSKNRKTLKVVELFAGVGGFRLGLEKCNSKKEKNFNIVWANQFEPSTKAQHAFEVYSKRFHSGKHSNKNIEEIIEKDFSQIPLHNLLVGGFPCQDYSVARPLSQADGLIGKKGVLWWSIYNILKTMKEKKNGKHPEYLMLENVDRLLKSPAKQRGRDFAIMLASLSDLGYVVEWRVINAADYGEPQRRRRVFIMAYRDGTPINKKIRSLEHPSYWILDDGVVAQAFPVEQNKQNKPIYDEFLKIEGKLHEVSALFQGDADKSPFENTGVMIDRKVYTIKTNPFYEGKRATLKDVLMPDKDVPCEYYIDSKDMKRWEYLKGAKSEPRKSSSGHEYQYSEGSMIFPDEKTRPSRTIVTGEGGSSPSRFKHVIKTRRGLRRLTPLELERLNGFPDNHTKIEGVSDVRRAFFMGNALVVGVVEELGKSLLKAIR